MFATVFAYVGANSFLLIERLGMGSFGTVWKECMLKVARKSVKP